jgi:peptidoglycan hydrolase-like protein with peptidoglycan-binding domain
VTPTQIQRYQWVLADLLFLPDMTPRTLDGAIGPQTTAALRAFQRSERLPETGRLDAVTIAALDRALDSALASGHRPPALLLAGARPAVTGSHPTVAAIQTAATPSAPAQVVAVPPQVAQMLPPSTVAQLQTMPAPAVQSFVNDLVRKVASAENTVLSEGTGKDFTAVPVVVDGVVRAAVQQVNTTLAPQGWWARLTPNERIGYGVGGAVVGVALVGGLVYLFSGKDRR